MSTKFNGIGIKTHAAVRVPAFMAMMLWMLVAALPMGAQTADAISMRLENVKELINNKLANVSDVFTENFLLAVPAEQLTAGVQRLAVVSGPCTEIHITKRVSGASVEAAAITAKNYSIPVILTIEETSPYRIAGLFLKSPEKLSTDLANVALDLAKLEGKTSICIVDLDSNKTLLAADTGRAMPIGSAFKLYILGRLTSSVLEGKHSWNQVLTLRKDWFSLPSGDLHLWPVGAPFTLYTLAGLMISKSDNTATDHLLYFLGRESVEQMQFTMGNTHSSANIPFLSTLELFKLKFTNGGKPAQQYMNAEVESKREQLAALVSIPSDSIQWTSVPVLPDGVEWFASTADLCRAMAFLQSIANKQDKREVMDILGINRGLDLDKNAWPVVGFKGGSESGVLNLTYYLQRADGRRFALSSSWTRTDKDVETERLTTLVSGAIRVLSTLP